MNNRYSKERGIALLTVLVILTIFVVFAVAFMQTVRLEKETTANYKYGAMVQDTAKSGVESLREEFTNLVNGHDGIPYTGDEIRPYISLIDTWAIGKADVIEYTDPRTIYDLRRWSFNTQEFVNNPDAVVIHNGAIWEVRPRVAGRGFGDFDPFKFFSRRGIDEDPEGIVSDDGAPGLAGVDDDLDGLTDPPGRPPSEGGEEDDDEDGLRDEDGVEIRRAYLGESIDQGGRIDSLGMGFDNDFDFNGIDPAAARINLNIAGNRNLAGSPPSPQSGNSPIPPSQSLHTYHSGVHPSELDLEVFMTTLAGTRAGTTLAQRIIQFREGFTSGTEIGPGIGSQDEKTERETDGSLVGNSDQAILGVVPGRRDLVEGDRVDNDGDGLTDEEDEYWAGGPFLEQGRTPTDLVDNRGNRAFVMANGLDDGGVPNVADDFFEIDDQGIALNGEIHPGIDDLRETRPSDPYGDDAPARSRLMVQLIDGMTDILTGDGATIHQIVQHFITVDSTTQRFRQESEVDAAGNRVKLNPNLTITQTQTLNRQPINTLLPLAALDNDGDWGSGTTVLNSSAIIRDDSNENHIPDGNWDTIAETTSGFDLITGDDNRDFTDNDYDGRVDDNGDANGDGHLYYDPERHVDEDRPTYAGIVYSEEDDSDDRTIMRNLIQGNGFEKTDFGNFQNPRVLPMWEDRVDNNNNSVRWMADGIDNDGDGLTDESRYDEILSGVDALRARDEGVDEPGEWYLFSWDDDVENANYDNIDNDNDGLTDLREGDENENVGWTLERRGERLVFQCDEDPIDLQFVANLADAMDYSTDLDIADGATKLEIRNASREFTTEAFGMEAMRITEVMARPLIRLQAEDANKTDGANWLGPEDDEQDDQRVSQLHYETSHDDRGVWVFEEPIPKGRYYVLIYAFNNGGNDPEYHLEGVSANITSDDGVPYMNFLNSDDHIDSTTFTEKFFPSETTVRNGMQTPGGGRPIVLFTDEPVEIEGELTVTLNPGDEPEGTTLFSFDYVELYAPDAQFMEMVNFGETSVDLAGWEIRQGSETFKVDDEDPIVVAPGQFVVVYPQDDAKDENDGPSGIEELLPQGYTDDPGPEPVVLTAEDFIDNETTQFHLTSSLEEILFASSTARVVELWAPKLTPQELQEADPDLNSASKTLVDSFYYNGSSDDCSVYQTFHRQDKMVFFSQRRGDPTVSLLRHDKSLINATETIERYVHGPVRYLADDAVVTFETEGVIDPNEPGNAASFKPEFILGRATVPGATGGEDEITEYGETIFGLTEEEREEFESGNHFSDDNTITFHWPGILNHFREPFTLANSDNTPGSENGLPVLYVRGYGVPNTPIGVFDMDTSGDDEDERLRWHGDLLFVFDPSQDLDLYEDVVTIDNDSIRVTLRVPEAADVPASATKYGALNIPSATFAFSYIEVSAGFPDDSVGFFACDPGRDSHFYPDLDLTVDVNSRFLYMQRRRINDPNISPEAVSERSLRFRQGPLANCSPYLAGAFGRNIEKYSMGRGVFCGPTPIEMAQIMTRMEFQSDPTIDGLVNINVADQKVLCALPFFPPELRPEIFSNVRNRLQVNGLMSQVLVMGRSQRGFDGEIGEVGRDDDGDGLADLQDLGYTTSGGAPLSDRYAPSWDPPEFGPNGFGIYGFDDNGDGLVDDPSEYRSPGTDDGPYASVGAVSVPMLNPLTLKELRRLDSQLGNVLRPDGAVSLLDESDIHMMLGRMMNLSTVQANEFIVISRGRVIDTQVTEQDPELNNVLAEQHLEEDLSR